MNEQFVRLELDVCERVNEVARETRKKVSQVVNEILREYLARKDGNPAK